MQRRGHSGPRDSTTAQTAAPSAASDELRDTHRREPVWLLDAGSLSSAADLDGCRRKQSAPVASEVYDERADRLRPRRSSEDRIGGWTRRYWAVSEGAGEGGAPSLRRNRCAPLRAVAADWGLLRYGLPV